MPCCALTSALYLVPCLRQHPRHDSGSSSMPRWKEGWSVVGGDGDVLPFFVLLRDGVLTGLALHACSVCPDDLVVFVCALFNCHPSLQQLLYRTHAVLQPSPSSARPFIPRHGDTPL